MSHVCEIKSLISLYFLNFSFWLVHFCYCKYSTSLLSQTLITFVSFTCTIKNGFSFLSINFSCITPKSQNITQIKKLIQYTPCIPNVIVVASSAAENRTVPIACSSITDTLLAAFNGKFSPILSECAVVASAAHIDIWKKRLRHTAYLRFEQWRVDVCCFIFYPRTCLLVNKKTMLQFCFLLLEKHARNASTKFAIKHLINIKSIILTAVTSQYEV